MKQQFLLLLLLGTLASLFAGGRVTNVSVKSHWPWSGRIDITYSLESDNPDDMMAVAPFGYDNVLQRELTATNLFDDGAGEYLPMGGPYTMTWNLTADYPKLHGTDVVFGLKKARVVTLDGRSFCRSIGEKVNITAEEKAGKTFGGWWNVSGVTGIENAKTISFTMPDNDVSLDSYYYDNGEYLVVNLETGDAWDATTSPDLSDDVCRTTELWLRKIRAGIFLMGSPEDEVGRDEDEILHQVTLTKDFYIGVFEMTQRQYELITGEKPSYFNNAEYYAVRPVECVSYDMIRGVSVGAGWPANNNVDEESFLGKLRAKTGLAFDLPTEGQWEYACRAGTVTSINSGKNVVNPISQDSGLNEVGRNYYNGGSISAAECDFTGGTKKVGSFLPNPWGLFDMHGNVREWCGDWEYDYPTAEVVDPIGEENGENRVMRGGCWGTCFPRICRSAHRICANPEIAHSAFGFRVVLAADEE